MRSVEARNPRVGGAVGSANPPVDEGVERRGGSNIVDRLSSTDLFERWGDLDERMVCIRHRNNNEQRVIGGHVTEQLYKFNESLIVPAAAAHLSAAFGEEVTEADVLRLGLNGHLRLPIDVVNEGVVGRRGV